MPKKAHGEAPYPLLSRHGSSVPWRKGSTFRVGRYSHPAFQEVLLVHAFTSVSDNNLRTPARAGYQAHHAPVGVCISSVFHEFEDRHFGRSHQTFTQLLQKPCLGDKRNLPAREDPRSASRRTVTGLVRHDRPP